MPGAVPAQAEVHRDAFVRMPGILHERAQLVGREPLQSELVGRDAGHGRGLQVEEHRPADCGARRTASRQTGGAVGAGDVAAAVRGETHEPADRIEDVAAVRKADELLFDGGAVVLHAGLDEVVAGGVRDVVHQLQPGVERGVDRQEERQSDAEAVVEIHGNVRERPAAERGELRWTRQPAVGHQGALVPARAILARPLDAQLVGEGVGEQRAQAAVDRVGAVALDAVGRCAPRVDVEGAVHLLGPGVVVLERCLVPAVEVQVQLGQQRAGVVRALYRSELVVEQPRPAHVQEAFQLQQIVRVPDIAGRLFRLGGLLQVVGQEEEGAVAHQRAAPGHAGLIAEEIGPPAPARVRERRRNLVPLPVVVGRAGEFVRSRLGDHVDEPAGRAAELGSSALIDHHQLFDGVLIEGESRALAAALLAEERVVEVGPVDDEVVEDAALAGDVQLVAVRPLRDRRAGREQRQVHEVAAVAGQRVDHVLQHALRARDVGGVDGRRQAADDVDGFGRHDLQPDVHVHRLAHAQAGALDALRAQAGSGRRHGQVVRARRQQRAHERARRRRLDRRHQVRFTMLDDDDRAGQRRAELIAHGAADDARRGPGLGGGRRRVEGVQDGRQDDAGQQPRQRPCAHAAVCAPGSQGGHEAGS